MSLFKLIMLLVYFNGKYTPLSLPSVLEQPVKPGISKVLTALVNLKTGGGRFSQRPLHLVTYLGRGIREKKECFS